MGDLGVPTYWDEARSAIVLVKKQQTSDFDKEYFSALLRKHAIQGSVQSVHIPLKIRLEKKFDKAQLETGIVVFESHQTCSTFIRKFTENAFPLRMGIQSGCGDLPPQSVRTERGCSQALLNHLEETSQADLPARSLALTIPKRASMEKLQNRLTQALHDTEAGPVMESVLYPIQPRDIGIGSSDEVCALLTITKQADIPQMKEILTDELLNFQPVPEQNITTSIISIPHTTVQKLAGIQSITEEAAVHALKQEYCVKIITSDSDPDVIVSGHWIRLKALCDRILTQLQHLTQESGKPLEHESAKSSNNGETEALDEISMWGKQGHLQPQVPNELEKAQEPSTPGFSGSHHVPSPSPYENTAARLNHLPDTHPVTALEIGQDHFKSSRQMTAPEHQQLVTTATNEGFGNAREPVGLATTRTEKLLSDCTMEATETYERRTTGEMSADTGQWFGLNHSLSPSLSPQENQSYAMESLRDGLSIVGTLSEQKMECRKSSDDKLPVDGRGQQQVSQCSKMVETEEGKLYPSLSGLTDPWHTEEFPAPTLFLKYFSVIDAGIEYTKSTFGVDVSFTYSGQKETQVFVSGQDAEEVQKAKHYVTHQVQLVSTKVGVRNISVTEWHPTLVQEGMAKLDKQFLNTITHYEQEEKIIETCGQRLVDYQSAFLALMGKPTSAEDSVSYTLQTPMWKYISERVPRHVQDAIKGCNVSLNPKVQGPQTRVLIKGNNSDIHRVMDRLLTKVKELEPSLMSETVHPGRERKCAEELQSLFDKVVLTDGDGYGIILFGLSKDIDDAKRKLQDILTKDRKAGTTAGRDDMVVDQPSPDMTYRRPVHTGVVTPRSSTLRPVHSSPMSPSTGSYPSPASSTLPPTCTGSYFTAAMFPTASPVSPPSTSSTIFGSSATTASRAMSQSNTGMGQVRTSGATSAPTGTVSETSPFLPPRKPQDSVSRNKPDFSKMKSPPITLQGIKSKLQIHILEYNITEMRVDAVVTSASEFLQHRFGAAKAILQAAGEEIRRECQLMISMKNNAPIPKGTMYVSQPGKLPCKALMHAIVPSKRGIRREDIKMVADALLECFKEANLRSYKTIAFPALNAGFLGKDVATEAITTAITRFVTKVPSSSLEHVYLVDVNPDMVAYLQSRVGTMTLFSKTAFKGTEAAQLSFEHSVRSISDSTPEPCPIGSGFSQVLPPKTSRTKAEKASSAKLCPICLDAITQPKMLPCKDSFCTNCIDQALSKTRPACPVCGAIFGPMKGNQPRGDMNTRNENQSKLPGYPRCGVIVIGYHIPDGYQTDDHPNPGKRFQGLQTSAYLPDSSEGRKVLRLLQKAFDARLIFTIGPDNCVTWNGIHHKTNREGGPAKFGYPDPGYLQRVQDELAAKGIKE